MNAPVTPLMGPSMSALGGGLLGPHIEGSAVTALMARVARGVTRAQVDPIGLKRLFDQALLQPGAIGVSVTNGARGVVMSLVPAEPLNRAAEHAAAGEEQMARQVLAGFIAPAMRLRDGDALRRMAEAMAVEAQATRATTQRIAAQVERLRAGAPAIALDREDDDAHGGDPLS